MREDGRRWLRRKKRNSRGRRQGEIIAIILS